MVAAIGHQSVLPHMQHFADRSLLEYEIQRQKDLLKTLGSVPQETRGFDHDSWKTFKMRSKEDAPEYRYMPDPNLGALVLSPVCNTAVPFSLPYLHSP